MLPSNEEYIFLQITHREAGICYEANVDQTDLRLPFDLPILYRLVCSCFSGKNGHSGDLAINSGSIKVTFRALFGEYFPIYTEVVLREKERSDDDKLFAEILQTNQRLMDQILQLEHDNQKLNEENRRMAQRVTELETQNQTLKRSTEKDKYDYNYFRALEKAFGLSVREQKPIWGEMITTRVQCRGNNEKLLLYFKSGLQCKEKILETFTSEGFCIYTTATYIHVTDDPFL